VPACRIISWNVNGLNRKSGNNQFLAVFTPEADIVCLQETKYPRSEIHAEYKSPAGFRKDFSPIVNTLESGLALYSRRDFSTPRYGIDAPLHDGKSRIQTTDFGQFTLINLFLPEGNNPSVPLRYKMAFADAVIARLPDLQAQGVPVVICGDFSIAHTDLDVFTAERKSITNGISPAERERLDRIRDMGFVDAFRHCNPAARTYTWWPQKNSAKEQDLGWRFDYCFVSEDLAARGLKAGVLPRNDFSDHAPVWVEVDLP
jgi:exodeoxyribonuclease-3